MPQRSANRVNEGLHLRLRTRRSEIEAALLTRVLAVSDPLEALDPQYLAGLRAAVGAALDHGLAAVKLKEEQSQPPPPAMLAQARLAARNGVSLTTVLRRCTAGHALLVDFLIEEAGALKPSSLRSLLGAQAALLDRLLTVVGEEHTRESKGRHLSSTEQRATDHVERLLAGESLDTSQLAYDFEGHHLGLIAEGPAAAEEIRALAAPLDCRLLLVTHSDGVVWAWLGSRRSIEPWELKEHVGAMSAEASLAFGEPAWGLSGWRTTHRQAKAALPIALRSPKRPIRYADVALLASVFQDDLLATSLRELYLSPLQRERDGGELARKTLRAYFATERNVSSSAALLGVSRGTVTNRLHLIEGRLGRPLDSCAAELKTALQLLDLD